MRRDNSVLPAGEMAAQPLAHVALELAFRVSLTKQHSVHRLQSGVSLDTLNVPEPPTLPSVA